MKDTIQLNHPKNLQWIRSFNISDGEEFAILINLTVGAGTPRH